MLFPSIQRFWPFSSFLSASIWLMTFVPEGNQKSRLFLFLSVDCIKCEIARETSLIFFPAHRSQQVTHICYLFIIQQIYR